MLIDAHAHIDRYDLLEAEALQTALDEIHRHRILTISNSMDISSYERNLEIAKKSDFILPIFGIHPWNAPEHRDRLKELEGPITRSPILGEIGLDHHFVEDRSAYPIQRQIFEYFLDAAQEQEKIICLHTKGAEEEVLEILDNFTIPGVIVHWYSGSRDLFVEFLIRDCYFTFGVELRYSDHIQTLAKEAPLDRLLTETDNPGGPKSLIGHPGMPALIIDVVDGLAQLREISSEDMIKVVQSNLIQLTRRDPRLLDTPLRFLEEA